MLLTAIFAIGALVLVVSSLSGHRAMDDPMVRIGARVFGVVLAVMAVSFLAFTLRS